MRAEDIFLAALEQPTQGAREAYLDTACIGDAALRDQVAGLLRSHEAAGSFLNAPLFEVSRTVAPEGTTRRLPLSGQDEISLDFLAPPAAENTLGRIGHYDVTEAIGRGGMGVVLKARDTKLSRVVAIKVMAPELAC